MEWHTPTRDKRSNAIHRGKMTFTIHDIFVFIFGILALTYFIIFEVL